MPPRNTELIPHRPSRMTGTHARSGHLLRPNGCPAWVETGRSRLPRLRSGSGATATSRVVAANVRFSDVAKLVFTAEIGRKPAIPAQRIHSPLRVDCFRRTAPKQSRDSLRYYCERRIASRLNGHLRSPQLTRVEKTARNRAIFCGTASTEGIGGKWASRLL